MLPDDSSGDLEERVARAVVRRDRILRQLLRLRVDRIEVLERIEALERGTPDAIQAARELADLEQAIAEHDAVLRDAEQSHQILAARLARLS